MVLTLADSWKVSWGNFHVYEVQLLHEFPNSSSKICEDSALVLLFILPLSQG